MNTLSLFSGIGGLDLAAEWAGMETIAFCEYEEFPQKVLKKHWPNTPIFHDIKLLTKKVLEQEGIINSERTIELIHGGFPCQPYSVAGKRKGTEDDRDLWPEMFRIIKEIKPNWVVGENVANFANMELDRTISDLESQGYETTTVVLPACGVDAKHQRFRTFILAHTNSQRHIYRKPKKYSTKAGEYAFCDSSASSEVLSNSNSIGWDEVGIQIGITEDRQGKWQFNSTDSVPARWTFEPDVGRVADGISNRVDRIKSLGNAVVPQQAYPIFKAIVEIEKARCIYDIAERSKSHRK